MIVSRTTTYMFTLFNTSFTYAIDRNFPCNGQFNNKCPPNINNSPLDVCEPRIVG